MSRVLNVLSGYLNYADTHPACSRHPRDDTSRRLFLVSAPNALSRAPQQREEK